MRKCPKNMCGERLKVEEKGRVRMNYKKGRGGRKGGQRGRLTVPREARNPRIYRRIRAVEQVGVADTRSYFFPTFGEPRSGANLFQTLKGAGGPTPEITVAKPFPSKTNTQIHPGYETSICSKFGQIYSLVWSKQWRLLRVPGYR